MEKESKYKNYSVEDFVDDKEFRTWITSPDEIRDSFWLNFKREYPEKNDTIVLAQKIIEALVVDESDISRDEYQDSINQLKTYLDDKSSDHRRVNWFAANWRNVAAILLLPILSVGIYWSIDKHFNRPTSQVVQYVVPQGQKSKVILADGTQVWLNSGSTLSVSLDKGENRKVQLSGEAYFDVIKNKEEPFVVSTKSYSVKVFGTKFNVRAYDDQIESETVLKEGSISILTQTHEELKMTPGQRFFIDAKKVYSLNEVDPDLYTSWKDNILKINKEKLQNLVVHMEHWYGVKIQVVNFDQVKDLKYTFTIKTESLREMLELMRYVTSFEYKIDGDKVTLKYNKKELPMN